MGLMNTILGPLLNRAQYMLTAEYFWRKAFDDVDFRTSILDLIRQDQLFEKGIDSDGDIIGYYSEFTEMMNPEKRAGEPYTLKDTGAFYASMMIYIYENYIEIDADPEKTNADGETENLFYKYGENIIGLTDENMEEVGRRIAEIYRAEIINTLQISE